ncbi:MAG: cysteine--tRNA ligase [Rickettsiales bacterium]
MKIHLTNSLTRTKDEFKPIDENHIKMYACGPTVYDRPHLGNARSAVVYDLLYRLLKHEYKKVTYVRNITDVDDKIINAARENQEEISHLTKRMTDYYHGDMEALGCLLPDVEPRATAHIAQMITMINELIELGNAYVHQGHVLFSVDSCKDYGKLSRRSVDEMIAGARVEVAPYKKNPADFVLWKPAPEAEKDFAFASPWGLGRPGWHIECSVMSKTHLGKTFDIHGGGADLMFPHHENELAQSECANHAPFANYWVHNGFLTVEGEKMSKSLGNFTTVHDLLNQGIDGSSIRFSYMTAHYRKPLDFNKKAIEDAAATLTKFRLACEGIEISAQQDEQFMSALCDDLNTPLAIARLHELYKEDKSSLAAACQFLGLNMKVVHDIIPAEIYSLAEQRLAAKLAKDFSAADIFRDKIQAMGYTVLDEVGGYKIVKLT